MAAHARYWLLTIPADAWSVPETLDTSIAYIKGQQEEGNTTGYRHWQLLAVFKAKQRLRTVRRLFGERAHCEPSRSDAADAYVWKEDTRIAGTQFELGYKPVRRNNKPDWERVWQDATAGRLMDVPAEIRVLHYRTLRTIRYDHLKPVAIEREVKVFWGRTGLGKSRDAWSELGMDAYPKDPRTKFWDGYQDQEHVIIDEFRGAIDIAHLLRWTDRYPVNVEIKGSAIPLMAKKIIITSNLHPKDWYPGLDEETYSALLRRLRVIHYDSLQ